MWDLLILGGIGYISYKLMSKKTKKQIEHFINNLKEKI